MAFIVEIAGDCKVGHHKNTRAEAADEIRYTMLLSREFFGNGYTNLLSARLLS